MATLEIVILSSSGSVKCCVGDYVKVRGAYASSASAKSAPNTAAIGWTRRVTRILPGENYPLCFGDDKKNATGWIKPSNLEFIKRGSF